jgi:hypothetical protein
MSREGSPNPRTRRSARHKARAEYQVRAKVWLYPGAGGWHFANLSRKQSAEIKDLFGSEARGFGSLPVSVKIGRTEWTTSIFPDRKSGSYLFAIKAEVRRQEDIAVGDTVSAIVRIR